MCGRFVSATTPDEIGKYFDAAPVDEALLEPSYNVAPTMDVYVVVEEPGPSGPQGGAPVRKVDAFHWGLVPFWAKSPAVGSKMINARAETLADKGAFTRAFTKRRCIIPADGFYEWAEVSGQKKKQPMYLERPDGEPMAFAGLWEVWRGPNGDGSDHLRSATIVTGRPNATVAKIHDRMPVVLPPEAWATWLDPEVRDLELLGELLVPAPDRLIAVHPVSTLVNDVRNDGPQLRDEAPTIAEVEAAEQAAKGEQGTLDVTLGVPGAAEHVVEQAADQG
jgi:putative SOS response-associated peptidase YedK